MLVSDERRQPEYPERNLSEQRRERTKTQPTYGATPGFEPRPHWWEASALTTAPPYFPHNTDDDDDDDDDDSQRESFLTVYSKDVCDDEGEENRTPAYLSVCLRRDLVQRHL